MNSIIFKIFVGLALSLAIIFGETDSGYTCGYPDYDKYQISYVDPDLFSDSLYQSFYRPSFWYSHTKDSYWDDGEQRDFNIEEWEEYFGKRVSSRSLHDLIYSLSIPYVYVALQNITTRESRLPDTIYQVSNKQYVDYMLADSLCQYYKKVRNWSPDIDTLVVGQALRDAVERKDKEFLDYLIFAKRCEPHAVSVDMWEERTYDIPEKRALIERGLQLSSNCRSPFLKLRYGYQVVRMAHYAGDYERTCQLYDSLISPNPVQSTIRFRALEHKARAERCVGKPGESLLSYAQVFDSCEERREKSLLGYTRGDHQTFHDALLLATNNHQRAVLWMIRGLREPYLSFEHLEKMYELDPTSPQLTLMLLREVRRIESYLYSNKVTRDWESGSKGVIINRWGEEIDSTNVDDYGIPQLIPYEPNFERHIAPNHEWDTLMYQGGGYNGPVFVRKILSGREYINAFRTFVLKGAQERIVPEPAIWYMVGGYIDLMDDNFDMAYHCLEEAEQINTRNEDLQQQILLLDFMRNVKKRRGIDRSLENKFYTTLEWFKGKQEQNHHSKFNKVMAAIGQQYLIQNDVPRAVLAFARAEDYNTVRKLLDIYANHQELATLQHFLESPGRSNYEVMLKSSVEVSPESLYELRGTRLLREGRFSEAIALFNRLPSSYWQTDETATHSWYPESLDHFTPMDLNGNSVWFYSSTDTTIMNGRNIVSGYYSASAGSEEAVKARATKYNKLTFAQEAETLRNQAERHPSKAARTWFRLANLLFNNWRWGEPDGPSVGIYSYDGPTEYPFNISGVAQRMIRADKKFRSEFGSRELARNYYERAMGRTKEKELAARCAYMLDICRKRPQTDFHDHPSSAKQDRTGYNLLITKYRNTEFADYILSQCSIYKNFQLDAMATR